jgi:OmpA-OmpF porin, OOP family
MHAPHRSSLGRIAVVASGAMLLLAAHACAQTTVQMFDDAPSLEQLRSIMIPESRPGLSRTIVIQRPDTAAGPSPVQTVASQVVAPPRPPGAASGQPAPQVTPAAVSTPEPFPAATPATAPQANPATEAGVVGFHINFAFDSAELPASAHSMIERIAQLMQEAPQVKLRIEGHTDAKGSASYNISLSERRALSVGEYLVKQGIEPARLILVGKGMSEPLTHNPYEPANRRVQFVRVG